MRKIGRNIITIDRIVHDDKFLNFKAVEYSLKVKSSVYLGLNEDEIASEEYIVTCLIDQIKAMLTNESVDFAIQNSIIEKKKNVRR